MDADPGYAIREIAIKRAQHEGVQDCDFRTFLLSSRVRIGNPLQMAAGQRVRIWLTPNLESLSLG